MFDVDKQSGLTLIEVRSDLTVEDIKKATGAPFKVGVLSFRVLPPTVTGFVSGVRKPEAHGPVEAERPLISS